MDSQKYGLSQTTPKFAQDERSFAIPNKDGTAVTHCMHMLIKTATFLFLSCLIANAGETSGTWTGEGKTKFEAFSVAYGQSIKENAEWYRITSVTYSNIKKTPDSQPIVSCTVGFARK